MNKVRILILLKLKEYSYPNLQNKRNQSEKPTKLPQDERVVILFVNRRIAFKKVENSIGLETENAEANSS